MSDTLYFMLYHDNPDIQETMFNDAAIWIENMEYHEVRDFLSTLDNLRNGDQVYIAGHKMRVTHRDEEGLPFITSYVN